MAASTGSTSRRSAASDRRRSWRSTSTSHHSRSTPSGRNSPAHHPAVGLEPSERGADPLDGARRSGRRPRREERPVGAGVAGHQIDQRSLDRIGERRRQPQRHGHAERVAQPAGVLAPRPRAPRRRSHARKARRSRDQLLDPGRRDVDAPSTASHRGRARRRLSGPSRRSRSWTSSASRARPPSTRRCSSSSRSASTLGVEQLAQLLGAEQVARAGRGRAPARRPAARPAVRRPRTCRRRSTRTAATGRTARPVAVSTATSRTAAPRMSRSTSRSAGRSNTSLRHSRVASSRIGKLG